MVQINQNIVISTHSLTRRLTPKTEMKLRFYWHFNSQPHKEADYSENATSVEQENFNSQPHKEADGNFIQ